MYYKKIFKEISKHIL